MILNRSISACSGSVLQVCFYWFWPVDFQFLTQYLIQYYLCTWFRTWFSAWFIVLIQFLIQCLIQNFIQSYLVLGSVIDSVLKSQFLIQFLLIEYLINWFVLRHCLVQFTCDNSDVNLGNLEPEEQLAAFTGLKPMLKINNNQG